MKVEIALPRKHSGQQLIYNGAKRFNPVACGRRFGKTTLGQELLIMPALGGTPTAWIAPKYRYLTAVWREIKTTLDELILDKDEWEKRLKLKTGAEIEFWSAQDPDVGRSRAYGRLIIDEAAMIRDFGDLWQKALRPTLTDYRGDMFALSTPRGRGAFFDMYAKGIDPAQEDWAAFQMPTSANPYIDPEEIEVAKEDLPEMVFRQEYLAEFIEDAGGVFRGVYQVVGERDDNTRPRKNERYKMGVDLARTQDFTVITVLDSKRRQVYFERFQQISWERQKRAIKRVADLYDAQVMIDATGVGDPIYEWCRREGLRILPYKFNNKSKEQLIDNLAVLIESGDIDLMDLDVQTNELIAFQYELTPSRNYRMGAPKGMHDDTVTALALAAWSTLRKKLKVRTDADLEAA